jgi:methionyl-tRNA formyltransferase
MRVGFLGQTGPYAPPALRYVLAHRRGFDLALVVEGKRATEGRLEHRLRRARPGPLPEGNALAELARAAGIDVLETCDINAPTAIRTIADYHLDWLVCVGFDRLFVPELLATAPGGAVNVHPSMLPRWRGPSPLFWALRTGERNLGVTLHGIDHLEDHGVVFAQAPFVAPRRATGEELYHLAATVAAPVLVDVLERARAGALVGKPQSEHGVSRAPRPGPADVRVEPAAFGCEHLVDFCCGAPFFRTPWLRFGQDVFSVRRGLIAEPGRTVPGEYALSGTTLVVACRDGLAHLEIQV